MDRGSRKRKSPLKRSGLKVKYLTKSAPSANQGDSSGAHLLFLWVAIPFLTFLDADSRKGEQNVRVENRSIPPNNPFLVVAAWVEVFFVKNFIYPSIRIMLCNSITTPISRKRERYWIYLADMVMWNISFRPFRNMSTGSKTPLCASDLSQRLLRRGDVKWGLKSSPFPVACFVPQPGL